MHRFILPSLVIGCALLGAFVWLSRSGADGVPQAEASSTADVFAGDQRVRIVHAVAPAALMASASASAPAAEDHLQAAHTLILAQLRDPAGARFRNMRVLQGGEVVCVEVAAGEGSFAKAVVITRRDRAPSAWIDRGRELVAHTACEVA